MVNGIPQSLLDMETVACDNCGSVRYAELFRGSDLLHGLPGEFAFVKCLQCGWMRENPRLAAPELRKYYPQDYAAYSRAIDDERWLWKRWDRRYGVVKRCRSIERHVTGGRLLEVGCGTGIFLNEMRRRGWQVTGIEPNQPAADYARQRFGLEVFGGLLEEYVGHAGSLDVVALWNVLEHLAAPASALDRIQRLLRWGGLLVMSFPSYESLDRRIFGPAWNGWDIPRHLYVFPRASFVGLLRSKGFSLLTSGCPAGSYHSFVQSLQFWLRRRTRRDRWRYSDAVAHLARGYVFQLAAAPAFWLIDRLRLSSVMTYVFRNERPSDN